MSQLKLNSLHILVKMETADYYPIPDKNGSISSISMSLISSTSKSKLIRFNNFRIFADIFGNIPIFFASVFYKYKGIVCSEFKYILIFSNISRYIRIIAESEYLNLTAHINSYIKTLCICLF
jgi:hypothetical protein